MTYDSKPWLKSYDAEVGPEIEVPDDTALGWIESAMADFADRPAIRFLGRTITFDELRQRAQRLARTLADRGLGPGDVVAINLPNIPQCLVAQLGALRAGCATTGLSPLLTAPEMAYQLKDSGAKALITLDAIFEHRLQPVASELNQLRLVITTSVLEELPRYKQLLAKWLKKVPSGRVGPLPGKEVLPFKVAMRSPVAPPDVELKPESTVFVQYTGGTTGPAKGAVLSHRNLLANLIQFDTWFGLERGQEVFCSGFPFFHLAGLGVGMAGMAMGATQVLIPDPRNTDHIVGEMDRFRPTFMANVPSLYHMLLDNTGFRRLDFSRLHSCLSGAAPFPVELINDLERVVGAGKVVEVYGMTEASPLITMNPRRGPKKIGSVGLPLPSTRVRLVDLETGEQPVAPGESGEIIACGPQVMQGYHNKPEESARALRPHDGETWLHTGDVARMDADGYFTLVDRSKDMLNVGGYKVFSREVEEKLIQHPAISLCAIVGLPNPERPGSELVKLVVQKSPEHAARPEAELEREILSFAKENLSPYKVPKQIAFMPELPLTAVGKVDKKALR